MFWLLRASSEIFWSVAHLLSLDVDIAGYPANRRLVRLAARITPLNRKAG